MKARRETAQKKYAEKINITEHEKRVPSDFILKSS